MNKKSRKLYLFFTNAITYNTFLISMAKKLKQDFNIVLCTKNPNKIISKEFFKEKFFFPQKIIDFKYVRQLFKSVKKVLMFVKKPNESIIFCHTPVASHFVRLATFLKKPNIVYFVHGFRFNDSRNKIYNFFFKSIEIFLSKNTTSYITINNSDYKFVKKILKKPVIKVNGIGLEKKVKIKNKKNKNYFIVGMIGAYRKNKGYEVVIRNFKKIKQLIPNLKIETYGYDDTRRLNKLIKEERINDIEINKFEKRILNKIINFDILLHPSYREGRSVSIMQSLQYGIPVIARNIPGNKDLIKNNFNGYLFDTEVEMLNSLKKIYLNNNLRKRLSQNASKIITNNYLKDSINEKIKRFIIQF